MFPDLQRYYPFYYDIYKDFDDYKERKLIAEAFGVNYKISNIVEQFNKLDQEKQDLFVVRVEAMLKMIK